MGEEENIEIQGCATLRPATKNSNLYCMTQVHSYYSSRGIFALGRDNETKIFLNILILLGDKKNMQLSPKLNSKQHGILHALYGAY